MKKRGQVTIFVILAVVIVVLGILIFVFKDSIRKDAISSEIDPIYNSLTSCIEKITLSGISILESNGGYIKLPEFEAGSRYAPTSSRLDFVGVEIPYWYYMSASGLKKESIPGLENLENDLENYISKRVLNCDYSFYQDQGFVFVEGEPTTKVRIKDNIVEAEVVMELSIKKGEESYLIDSFKTQVDSKLGILYSDARTIYGEQKEGKFLEKYSVDVLNLYAPVDGVEFSCSPLTWSAPNVFSELSNAFENNLASISNRKDSQDYFYLDSKINSNVKFLTSSNWPSYLDVNPTQGPLMLAEPLGNSPEMGILGFCYIPYHFVYNIRYPVLVQIFNQGEIFQFPLTVLIEGNMPGSSLNVTSSQSSLQFEDICEQSNSNIKINVYGENSKKVEANLTYVCLDSSCNLGETQGGILETKVVQCANGEIVASSEGYKDFKITHSSIQESSVDLVLERAFEKEVKLNLGNYNEFESAVITFDNGEKIQTLMYPSQKQIKLSEGLYEISASIYSESNLELDNFTKEQCINSNKGIKGFFGVTSKECFDVEFPSSVISNVLAGGGSGEFYFDRDDLESLNILEINSDELEIPENLDDLQNNHLLFELLKLEVSLK